MSEDLGKWTKTKCEIEIRSITVEYRDVNHKKIRWSFNPYEVFEILKNITKSEAELGVMMGSPEEAITNVVKVINRKYRAKGKVILTWRAAGYTQTQETYIRARRANQLFEKIDGEGNALVDQKTSITFDAMRDITPQIKTEAITEENSQHKNFKLQEIGDVGEM